MTRKLKLLQAHIDEVYENLAGCSIAGMWPYSGLIYSLGDQNAYLESIIEGYSLSLDPDFCEVVRSSVEEIRATPEPRDCPTAK